MVDIHESVLAVIPLEKSDTDWVPLLLVSIVLLLFAGFNTTPPSLLNYLTYDFLRGGVITLILAAHAILRWNKESIVEDSDVRN